jgi:hypothetical protein
MFNEHAVSPEFVFIWKSLWVYHGCRNNIGPGGGDSRHTRQKFDGLLEVRIAFEDPFVLQLCRSQKLNLAPQAAGNEL